MFITESTSSRGSSLNILAPLTNAGIPIDKIFEEIMWINFVKGNMYFFENDGHDYIYNFSRVGRDFAMNRRQKKALVRYVTRSTEVISENVECYKLDRDLKLQENVT